LGEGTASLLLPVLQMMCIVGMDFFNRPVNHGLAQPCTHLARCVVQLFKLYLFGSAKTAQALIVMICVNLGTWAYQVRARKGDGVVVYDAWCGGGTYFFVPFTITCIGCQVSTCTTGAPVGWQRITRTHGYMPFPF
jgi:hypothetical protein